MPTSPTSELKLNPLKAAALAFHAVTGFALPRRLRADTQSWDELVSYAFSFGHGLAVPCQVPSEIRCLLKEVGQLRPRRLLEIGTARGGTFFLLSRAAAPDATLISLDLPDPAEKWMGVTSFLLPRLLLPGQSGHFVRADSHAPETEAKISSLLGGSQLDLLFIDADHSYEAVKQDFDMYSELVRPGGMVAFHDIAVQLDKRDSEVDRFWGEVKERFPHQEFIEDVNQGWAGIGILRV